MKILLAILLLLNQFIMVGAMAYADLPDEDHPFGKAVKHDNLHHHSHDDHTSFSDEYAIVHGDLSQAHDDIDSHHEHGIHIHWNMDLPTTIVFEPQNQSGQQFIASYLPGKSQTYSPPVPPPIS